MSYSMLPPVREDKELFLHHFPNRFYAVIFRLWETVAKEKIAKALGVSVSEVQNAAKDMGLPPQKHLDAWEARGYITTIRNMWHLLPYEQLLALFDWTEEKLAFVLKEDDFLEIKLGIKPHCPPVKPEPLTAEGKGQLNAIKALMEARFSDWFDGKGPFDFFDEPLQAGDATQTSDLRLIYSFCGLYAGVLEQDTEDSYPDSLLNMYRAAGVNAVWLPVVLYQMVPFPFDESYSIGWEDRQARLKNLIARAKKYGIDIYLYLNEPRCMPLSFFEKHSELKGTVMEPYAALCSSHPEVMQYLRNAVRTLCEAVPDLGGFFTITCSENLTNCKSKGRETDCPRCRNIPVSQLVADVLCAISEESRKVNSKIRTIAWTWAWDALMTEQERFDCIDRLPKEVILQSNSEAMKPYTIGGISGTIQDYSMSIPGPAELPKQVWRYAKEKGHEVCAKVQVNVTWECSTIPFLPVFDLIREHMMGLKEEGVRHLMLSWTLGGYPAVNLKVASKCLIDPSEESYDRLLTEEYGAFAPTVKAATKIFSDAFREFPFHIDCLYHGPQNAGPSNLLYAEPSGFSSTMTCYAFDDLDTWRSIYPRDIYIDQLRKLSEGWKEGLALLDSMPDGALKQAAWGGYALFRSSYLQAEFIDRRDKSDRKALLPIIAEEKELALLMYDLMQKNSCFGFEAANHYYFNKGMLIEKVLSCTQMEIELSK